MLSTTTELKKGKAPLSQVALPLSVNNTKKKNHALQFILQCFVYLVLNDSWNKVSTSPSGRLSQLLRPTTSSLSFVSLLMMPKFCILF